MTMTSGTLLAETDFLIGYGSTVACIGSCNVTSNGNLTVGGTLHANSGGFAGSAGPCTGSDEAGGGGGHAGSGAGGQGCDSTGYGSAFAPVTFGSKFSTRC